MKETATVSVVIPVCNGEKFLREVIESARAQTLQVTEIIGVDDSSKDRRAELAGLPADTVIGQPNTGLPAARNAGIRASSQPWIALLDQDDVWSGKKSRLS